MKRTHAILKTGWQMIMPRHTNWFSFFFMFSATFFSERSNQYYGIGKGREKNYVVFYILLSKQNIINLLNLLKVLSSSFIWEQFNVFVEKSLCFPVSTSMDLISLRKQQVLKKNWFSIICLNSNNAFALLFYDALPIQHTWYNVYHMACGKSFPLKIFQTFEFSNAICMWIPLRF